VPAVDAFVAGIIAELSPFAHPRFWFQGRVGPCGQMDWGTPVRNEVEPRITTEFDTVLVACAASLPSLTTVCVDNIDKSFLACTSLPSHAILLNKLSLIQYLNYDEQLYTHAPSDRKDERKM
jgi:hypothetical protein